MKVPPMSNVPIGMMNMPKCNGSKAAVTTFAVMMDTKYNKILNIS
jgi:hypothetical protein